MWGERKPKRETRIDSLISHGTQVVGNVMFRGTLHVDGVIKGNITAEEGADAVLVLSEQGLIEGEIRVPNVALNGQVNGNIYSNKHIELAVGARITGNVHYNVIEVAMGAEVNGNLVHTKELPPLPPNLKEEPLEPLMIKDLSDNN